MSNYWKQEGIPHRGWTLVNVIDIREDGQSEWETDYKSCMMCGNEKIRYVHILQHPELDEEFEVGCNCAEKMTDDYVNPKLREKILRNRALRKTNWFSKKWKRSSKGSFYLNIEERTLIIFRDKKTNEFKLLLNRVFGKKAFRTLDDAKAAAFEGVEYLKDKGMW